MAQQIVTGETISHNLKELGIKPGDLLVVHSSLSSFGRVDGGADTVVDSLLEVVAPGGTLVVPTFTSGSGVFDPLKSPSTSGAITEVLRTRKHAVRSLHPTHSVAAIGPLADGITEGHDQVHAFGRGSPLFKILQARGKILQIGTTHTTNSMIHVAEEIAGVGYLDRSQPAKVITSRGKHVSRWVRRPGCSMGFDVVEAPMQSSGAIAEIQIGRSRVRLMTARSVVDEATELLRGDAEALLCDRPECGTCAEARAILTALQIEEQEKEIIRLAEEDERTVRMIEKQFDTPVTYFDPDTYEQSPN